MKQEINHNRISPVTTVLSAFWPTLMILPLMILPMLSALGQCLYLGIECKSSEIEYSKYGYLPYNGSNQYTRYLTEIITEGAFATNNVLHGIFVPSEPPQFYTNYLADSEVFEGTSVSYNSYIVPYSGSVTVTSIGQVTETNGMSTISIVIMSNGVTDIEIAFTNFSASANFSVTVEHAVSAGDYVSIINTSEKMTGINTVVYSPAANEINVVTKTWQNASTIVTNGSMNLNVPLSVTVTNETEIVQSQPYTNHWDNWYQTYCSVDGLSYYFPVRRTFTLTNLFTTERLVSEASALLPDLGGVAWGRNSDDGPAKTTASRQLAANEFTITLRSLAYRLSLVLPVGEPYKLEWEEKFTPDNGGATVIKKLSEWVVGTGQLQYSSEHIIPPPATDGVTEVILPKSACSGGICGFGAGAVGGDGNGSGIAQEGDGVHLEISLGADTEGSLAGKLLLLGSEYSDALASPTSLAVIGSEDLEVYRDANGVLLQAKGPDGLAVVSVVSATKYTITFYSDAGTFNGDVYQDYDEPRIEWTIEKAAADQLTIANDKGLWNEYTYDSGTRTWTLDSTNSLRTTTTAWSAARDQRIFQAKNGAQVVYAETANYFFVTNGEITLPFLSQRTVGSGTGALTNYHFYITDTSDPRFGLPELTVHADGSWEKSVYDTNRRTVQIIRPLLNAATSATSNDCRVVAFDYQPLASSGDDGSVSPDEPRTITEWLGTNMVSQRFAVIKPGERLDIQAASASAVWSNAQNLVTTTWTYANANGEFTIVKNPDATLHITRIWTNAQNARVETVTSGSPDPSGTNVLDGTQTTTLHNGRNDPTNRVTVVINAGTNGLTIASESYTYGDPENPHRVTRVDNLLDGTYTTSTYTCCGLDNTRDREGTYTYYFHDALKRQTATQRAGIIRSNVLDAAGNVLQEIRIATNGTRLTNATHVYDLAGQLVATFDALNHPTYFTNYFDGTYWVKKTTFPDSAERLERYYRDGQLYEVTGSAVQGVRYEYGVDASGPWTKTILLDTNASPTSQWTKTYTDFLGRAYKTEYSAASSPYPARLSYYDSRGHLTNEVDPDGVSTLYLYNDLGELYAQLADLNANGDLDAGDRVTGYAHSYREIDGHLADVRTVTNALGVVSETATALDALISWQIAWGLTNTTVTTLDGTGGRTVTTTAPDGTYTVSSYQDGYLLSVGRYDASGSQLAKTTCTYDEFGRQQTATDARANTVTTLAYDAADRLTTTTVSAPGLADQTTTVVFDSRGRVRQTVLPDGGTVTNDYFATGLLKTTTGARAYPVAYGYDAQGRMTSLNTWTNYPAGTGLATTTWKLDSYRGFLTNKVYADGKGPKYTYTTAGRLRSRIADYNWATNSYAWNGAGELSAISYVTGGLIQPTDNLAFGRNALGQLAAVTNGSAVITLAYNQAGQLAAESHAGGVLNGLSVTNHYNALLQRESLAVLGVSGAPTVNYAHTAGRLATVSFGSNSVEYFYWPNSALLSNVVFKSGGSTRMTTSRTYDGFNRLTGISSAPAGASAVSFQYAYNQANQRVAVTNADSSRVDYGYDALGQVTSGTKYWADGSPVAGQQFEYGFDTIGNRRTHSWGGDTNGANLRLTTYSVNLLNQITGRNNPGYVTITGEADTNAAVKVNGTATSRHGRYFAGEAPVNNASPVWLGITNVAVAATNGSSETYTKEVGHVFVPAASQTLTTIHEGCLYADGRWYYRWDAENRLVKMTAASAYVGYPYQELGFTHDWMGRRISKVVSNKVSGVWYLETSRKFLYDGWNLVAELDGSNVLQRTHVWGLDASGTMQGAGGVGGLLATILHTGTNAGVYFPAYDGNHNVVAYNSAATGAIVAEYEYGPFGELLRATGPLAKEFNFLFSTKYHDWETGLYYYGYRYYNPNTGRWLNRDPIEEHGGPNTYAFLNNSAIAAFDYLGYTIATPCSINDYLNSVLGLNTFKTRYKLGVYYYDYNGNVMSIKGAPSHKMIIARMMKTTHLFQFSNDNGGVLKNIQSHLNARMTIANNARTCLITFGTGPKVFVPTIPGTPLPSSIDPDAYFKAMNNPATTMACQALTELIFQTGNQFNAISLRKMDVWIPGDWGYIRNTPYRAGSWGPGLQGENVIHVGTDNTGEDLFWGHGGGIHTESAWFSKIYLWQSLDMGTQGFPVWDFTKTINGTTRGLK